MPSNLSLFFDNSFTELFFFIRLTKKSESNKDQSRTN